MELAERIYNLLDPYEIRDTDTTAETIAADIVNNPLEVIAYLVEMIEENN